MQRDQFKPSKLVIDDSLPTFEKSEFMQNKIQRAKKILGRVKYVLVEYKPFESGVKPRTPKQKQVV